MLRQQKFDACLHSTFLLSYIVVVRILHCKLFVMSKMGNFERSI